MCCPLPQKGFCRHLRRTRPLDSNGRSSSINAISPVNSARVQSVPTDPALSARGMVARLHLRRGGTGRAIPDVSRSHKCVFRGCAPGASGQVRRGLRRASAPPEQLVNGTSGPSIQAVSEEEPLLVDRGSCSLMSVTSPHRCRDTSSAMPNRQRRGRWGRTGSRARQKESPGQLTTLLLVRNAPRR